MTKKEINKRIKEIQIKLKAVIREMKKLYNDYKNG
jgi:hypothetical protein